MAESASPTATARLAIAGLVALAATELLWEMWLAPLRPGGSWLALKALPLALFVPWVARGSRRARQGLALLLPFYLAEAVMRGVSETGRRSFVAWVAAALAATTFAALLAWVRGEKARPRA